MALVQNGGAPAVFARQLLEPPCLLNGRQLGMRQINAVAAIVSAVASRGIPLPPDALNIPVGPKTVGGDKTLSLQNVPRIALM